METYTLDDIKKEVYGEIGTPRRDKIEAELASLRIGIQIRNAREARKMTQSQLAEKIGPDPVYPIRHRDQRLGRETEHTGAAINTVGARSARPKTSAVDAFGRADPAPTICHTIGLTTSTLIPRACIQCA